MVDFELIDKVYQSHPYGYPIQIWSPIGSENNKRRKDEFEHILSHPVVSSRHVVILSVIGAFRRGKSFLLDYCLRFMYANYFSINNRRSKINEKEWMGQPSESLQGFSWRSGSERDTTGIIMWSDVFLYTNSDTGEKLAILLMDTQGLFDGNTSPVDNSKIFALGSLLSSTQIFNLSGNIQEDQLAYLQFAATFAKLIVDKEGSKPFQNLFFLIRDWEHVGDFSFGLKGGQSYLEKKLEIQEKHSKELVSVRNFILNDFQCVQGCLLPHPGDEMTRKGYNGEWKNLKQDFKKHLRALIEKVLSPECLEAKTINGVKVKANEFKGQVESVLSIFDSDNLPEVPTLYQAMVDKRFDSHVASISKEYKYKISQHVNADVKESEFAEFHENYREASLDSFKTKVNFGDVADQEKFLKVLDDNIWEYFLEMESCLLKILDEKELRVQAQLLTEIEVIQTAENIAFTKAHRSLATGVVGAVAVGAATHAEASAFVGLLGVSGGVGLVAVTFAIPLAIGFSLSGFISRVKRWNKQAQLEKMKKSEKTRKNFKKKQI